jgi:hypothetical protein
MDSWLCLQRAVPSVHGMLCVCHDRLPMLFVSTALLLVRTVSLSQFTFCLFMQLSQDLIITFCGVA